MKHLEQKTLINEKKYQELSIQNEMLDREIADLLKYCEVTEDQLTTYVNSKEYFTEEQWAFMQEEKKRLDEELELKLACIRNLAKQRKNQQERAMISPHWLFVR